MKNKNNANKSQEKKVNTSDHKKGILTIKRMLDKDLSHAHTGMKNKYL